MPVPSSFTLPGATAQTMPAADPTLTQQAEKHRVSGVRYSMAANLLGMSEDSMRTLIRRNRLPAGSTIPDFENDRILLTKEFVESIRTMSEAERKELPWWPRSSAEIGRRNQENRIRREAAKHEAAMTSAKDEMTQLIFSSSIHGQIMRELVSIPYVDGPIEVTQSGQEVYHPLAIINGSWHNSAEVKAMYPIHKSKALTALVEELNASVDDTDMTFSGELAMFAKALIQLDSSLSELVNFRSIELMLKAQLASDIVYNDKRHFDDIVATSQWLHDQREEFETVFNLVFPEHLTRQPILNQFHLTFPLVTERIFS